MNDGQMWLDRAVDLAVENVGLDGGPGAEARHGRPGPRPVGFGAIATTGTTGTTGATGAMASSGQRGLTSKA